MRRFSIASQIAFFILTTLAVAALYFFCELLRLPKGWIVLAVSIALAESLIRRGFWRTGVEAGLWIGGLCGFILSLPSSGKPEAILVFVAAFAIVAVRLKHPFFGVIAVALTFGYLGAKRLEPLALPSGLAVSLIASRLSGRLFFGFTAVVAPLAGYLVYANMRIAGTLSVVVVLFAIAALDLAIGIRIRERAPLIAAAVCVGIGCFEARNLIGLTVEAKLILGGAALLAISSALMRALRDRKTGIVVTPLKPHELQDAMQMGAMLPLATPDAGRDSPGAAGGGGEFGGAGASGQY